MNVALASMGMPTVQSVEARVEQVLDDSNKNLAISTNAPDDWNSGKLSSTILSVDWKLNGLFATNIATKLFSTSEPLAVFAIVNSPSVVNLAIPFAQKTGLLSMVLSGYVTINRETDITLSDGSSAHLYSLSVSLEQLRKVKAPIDKALDVVLITTQQQGGTYIVVYATELGKMGQYQKIFDGIRDTVKIGGVSFSGITSPSSSAVTTPSTDTSPRNVEETPSPLVEPPAQSSSRLAAELSASNEVPPVDSEASGMASFSIVGNSISYEIKGNNIGQPTGAHLHRGTPGENGDVIVDLLMEADVSADNQEFTITGTLTDSSLTGPLVGGSIGELIDLMNEEVYVNVHTSENADGERKAGQLE